MELAQVLPIWPALTPAEQHAVGMAASLRTVAAGTLLHAGSEECTGFLLVTKGQLRVYSMSPQGRAITLYRLFERDLCLFSAPCVLHGIRFDVMIEAVTETSFWLIPALQWQMLMQSQTAVANWTNEIMASRFSEVMWLLEQVLWQRMDSRLAALLLEEAALADGDRLTLTHDALANHLGTAREVVTRMLRYLQREGMVTLSRGCVTLTDRKRLQVLADGS